jgi:gliding motility-associated-like protein
LTLKGKGGVYYEWTGPADLKYAGQSVTFKVSNLASSGLFTLTVTDAIACKGVTSKLITINDLPYGGMSGSREGCVPFCGDYGFASGSGNARQIRVEWDGRGLRLSKPPDVNGFSTCISDPGIYIISGKYTDTITTCINTQTFVIEAYEKPQADFTWLPERPVEGLEDVIFTNATTGQEQKSWSWYFAGGAYSEGEQVSNFYKQAGSYPVAMIVENKWGCIDSAIKYIKIAPDFGIYVPNVFSPNGDGLNDVFLPIVNGVKKYRLEIFDRWGERVFLSLGPEASAPEAPEGVVVSGWDGTFKGEICKQDIYIWKIWLTSIDGKEVERLGEVMLYR